MKKFFDLFFAVILAFSFILFTAFILLICNSCTYSINMIHSEGTATDLIDENQTADPNINPNLNLPTL